jgi:hypothetical protein
MKRIILFLLFFWSNNIFGQQYKTSDIVRKADSLIITIVGKDIFENHYQIKTIPEIDPVQIRYDKEKRIKPISLTSNINKNEEPTVSTRIIFDKNLNSQFPVDTSFIPKFILQKKRIVFYQRRRH